MSSSPSNSEKDLQDKSHRPSFSLSRLGQHQHHRSLTPDRLPSPSVSSPSSSAASHALLHETSSSTAPNFLKLTIVPVYLKEAAIDSPSFRATVVTFSEQIDAIDKWIESVQRSNHKFNNELSSLQDTLNVLISKACPPPVASSLIDQNYISVGLRLSAETNQEYWSKDLKLSHAMFADFSDPLVKLQKHEIQYHKQLRKSFESAQSRYDNLLSRYLAQSKSKEPSSLREDAFQLFESKKHYLKAALDLAVNRAAIKTAIDTTLVRCITTMWQTQAQCFTGDLNALNRQFLRLSAWSDSLGPSRASLIETLVNVRKTLEQKQLHAFRPPRDLSEYAAYKPNNNNNNIPHQSTSEMGIKEKHSWVFVKTWAGKPARQHWVRRWAFVKDGLFGFLSLDPTRKFVQESDKLGVLLCNTHILANNSEDRRFCFEVQTKDATLIIQAETQAEVFSWLSVFQVCKQLALQHPESSQGQNAFAIIPPSLPEFAANQTSCDTDIVHEPKTLDVTLARIPGEEIPKMRAGSALQALVSAGQSLASHSSGVPNFLGGEDLFDSNTLEHPQALSSMTIIPTPMSTEMTKLAVLSHSYIRHMSAPNAMEANIWGSSNWVLDSHEEEQRQQQENEKEKEKEKFGGQLKAKEDDDGNKSPRSSTTELSSSDQPNDQQIKSHRPSPSSGHNERYWSTGLPDYPSYYPNELRLMDAQLRALAIVPNDDRVLLTFRLVWIANRTLELSSLGFFTTKSFYLYTNTSGFVVMRKFSLERIVSVRCKETELYDLLIFDLLDDSEVVAKIFLEPALLLQTRINILIDNLHQDDPLSIEELIPKLKAAEPGTLIEDQLESPMHHTNDRLEKNAPNNSDDVNNENTHDSSPASPVKTPIGVDTNVASIQASQKSPNTRTLLSPSVDEATAVGPQSVDDKKLAQSPTVGDGSFNNNQQQQLLGLPVTYTPDPAMKFEALSVELSVSAKALFHVMFGDKSPVFQNIYRRLDAGTVQQTGWIETDSQKHFRREFKYEVVVQNARFQQEIEELVDEQQIEVYQDQRLYVISQTFNPWNVPYRDTFLLNVKFVITAVSRSHCRLTIYEDITWFTRPNIIVKYVISKLMIAFSQRFAKSLYKIIRKNISKLGDRSRTIKAIHVYGHVGHHVTTSFFTAGLDESESFLSRPKSIKDGRKRPVFLLRQRTISYLVLMLLMDGFAGTIVALFFEAFWWVIKSIKKLGAHSTLLALLSVSIALNMIMMGRTGVSYWIERSSYKMIDQIGIFPHGGFARAVYLNDLNEALSQGANLTKSGNADGVCYKQFLSAVSVDTFKNFSSETVHWEALHLIYDDVQTRDFARRVRQLRAEAGQKRFQHAVAINVINRAEKEMVEAEWQTWVRSEHYRCRQLEDLARRKVIEAETNGCESSTCDGDDLAAYRLWASGDDGGSAKHDSLASDPSLSLAYEVLGYCTSCDSEFEHINKDI